MLAKVKSFAQRHRYSVMSAFMMSMLVCSAFAVNEGGGSSPSFDLTSVMQQSVTKIVSDLFAMMTGVLPILITLFGASVGITYSIKFIQRITHKG